MITLITLWTLGVGLTSVILTFAMFRFLSKVGLAKDFTILENNAMQSIATSAGYMTSPLIASFAAYMMMTNKVVSWPQMVAWNVALSVLGVLVAFPLKRRFINDEQQPFPEGRACGVVLDTLYSNTQEKGAAEGKSTGADVGMIKAYALLAAALLAAGIQFASGLSYQAYVQCRLMGQKAYWVLSESLDSWYYALATKFSWLPTGIGGVPFPQLGLHPTLDLSMIGAGGLTGPRVANSLMIGMLLNFAVLAPWMINLGEIPPHSGALVIDEATRQVVALGTATFDRPWLVAKWCLWWGVSMMVAASMVSLFAKPKIIIGAFAGMFSKKRTEAKILDHIELPLWISYWGVPIFVTLGIWMGHEFFGIVWWHGLIAIPLILILTLIAVNSTALTSTTPGGAIAKITQFTIGTLDRSNPATNLMTAGMAGEVALNASNLLMDIKPGYMLGAKPRQQAWGHVLGIISGAIASTPLFFVLFLRDPKNPPTGGFWSFMEGPAPGTKIDDLMIHGSFGFPAAVQWRGIAMLIRDGAKALPSSALKAMIIAAAVAIAFEVARIVSKGRFPLSALAIGLGVVLPTESTFMMWCGAMFFWLMGVLLRGKKGTTAHTVLVDSHEPICAGLITGAALIGIGDKLVEVFLLK